MSYAIRVSSLDHAPTRSSSIIVGEKQDLSECCMNFPCCYAFNHNTVYIFAGVIWLIGFIVTAGKGAELLSIAKDNDATTAQIYCALIIPLVIGIYLGYSYFTKLAKRNIERIAGLVQYKEADTETGSSPMEGDLYWHSSFRWQLWLFLFLFDGAIMLISDATRSSSNAVSQLVFGGLNISVSAALGFSFYVYFTSWSQFQEDTGADKNINNNNGISGNSNSNSNSNSDSKNNYRSSAGTGTGTGTGSGLSASLLSNDAESQSDPSKMLSDAMMASSQA